MSNLKEVKADKQEGFHLVYSPSYNGRNVFYSAEFKNMWTHPKEKLQYCLFSVYCDVETFKEHFKMELEDFPNAEGGLTKLGFKLLKDGVL